MVDTHTNDQMMHTGPPSTTPPTSMCTPAICGCPLMVNSRAGPKLLLEQVQESHAVLIRNVFVQPHESAPQLLRGLLVPCQGVGGQFLGACTPASLPWCVHAHHCSLLLKLQLSTQPGNLRVLLRNDRILLCNDRILDHVLGWRLHEQRQQIRSDAEYNRPAVDTPCDCIAPTTTRHIKHTHSRSHAITCHVLHHVIMCCCTAHFIGLCHLGACSNRVCFKETQGFSLNTQGVRPSLCILHPMLLCGPISSCSVAGSDAGSGAILLEHAPLPFMCPLETGLI